MKRIILIVLTLCGMVHGSSILGTNSSILGGGSSKGSVIGVDKQPGWKKNIAASPVMSGFIADDSTKDTKDPFVFVADDKYYMYFSYGSDTTGWDVGYATTTDLDSLDFAYQGIAIPRGVTAEFEDRAGVFAPCVNFDGDSTYYIFYTAADRDSGSGLSGTAPWSIWYATASSPDGPWTKQAVAIDADGVDEQHSLDPWIYEENGTFYMYYARGEAGFRFVGLSTSSSLDGPWTEPVSVFSDYDVEQPVVVKVGETYILYVDHTSGGSNPAPNGQYRIEAAYGSGLTKFTLPDSPVIMAASNILGYFDKRQCASFSPFQMPNGAWHGVYQGYDQRASDPIWQIGIATESWNFSSSTKTSSTQIPSAFSGNSVNYADVTGSEVSLNKGFKGYTEINCTGQFKMGGASQIGQLKLTVFNSTGGIYPGHVESRVYFINEAEDNQFSIRMIIPEDIERVITVKPVYKCPTGATITISDMTTTIRSTVSL